MSKLQYNVEVVTDLVVVDQNTITGKIGESTVEFRRRLDGWHVNFVILIDGILLHDSEATPVCKDAFQMMMNKAWLIKYDQEKAVRAKSLPALNKLITITD